MATPFMSPADTARLQIILDGMHWMGWVRDHPSPHNSADLILSADAHKAIDALREVTRTQSAEAVVFRDLLKGPGPSMSTLCSLDLSRVDIDQDSMQLRVSASEYVEAVLGAPRPPATLQQINAIAQYYNIALRD